MHGNLRRRQREDQPAPARVDRIETEYIADEVAVGLRIAAVDDGVSADDQREPTADRRRISRSSGSVGGGVSPTAAPKLTSQPVASRTSASVRPGCTASP